MFGWGRGKAISSSAQTLTAFLLRTQHDMNEMTLNEFVEASAQAGREGERDDFEPEFRFREAGAVLPDFTFLASYQDAGSPMLMAEGFSNYCGVLITGTRHRLEVEIRPVGLVQEVGRDARALCKELLKHPGFTEPHESALL
jgi:hypothetical protein